MATHKHLLLGLCLLLAPDGASVAQFASVQPDSAGMSAERLDRIDGMIQRSVEQNEIGGVVTLVLRDGWAIYLKSFGMMDRRDGTQMTPDAIFRIASMTMTKAVTSVAVMMLYEQGNFLLNDPVSTFIPEFKDPVVAVADSADSRSYRTVPAKRQITIRHLLTHTAGLTYYGGLVHDAYREAGLGHWYLGDKAETIGDVVKRLAGLPLQGHPGEQWQYGYATDVLGYLVEVISGEPLDSFLEQHIFLPLGMRDTHFFLPRNKARRLAPVYGRMDDGSLQLRDSTSTTPFIHGPRVCFSGGAGLLSTITDYGRFLQMLLNGGQFDGARLLSPKSVQLMRVSHFHDYPRKGWDFGLGFWVLENLGEYGEVGSEGAYGWGSAYYPRYWLDPKERLVGIFMTQLLPAGDLNLHRRFQAMVYHAIID